MSVQTYAVESLLYRTAGLIDASIAQNSAPGAVLAAMEEFAVEASIAKVAGSETLDFVLDENVQIHGGNGFVQRLSRRAALPRCARESDFRGHERDQPAAHSRHADSTRAEGGASADCRRAQAAGRDSSAGGRSGETRSTTDAPCEAFKKVALMALGLAMQRYGEDIAEQQEVLIAIADIVIAAACAESALLRASAAAGGSWRRSMPMRRRSSSMTRPHGSRRRPGRCWRRWPKAIHSERIWRRCGGCSR